MTIWAKLVLVSCGTLLAYTWLGYPLLLRLFRLVFSRAHTSAKATPTFSIILAAYNEEKHIRAKLENCLALEYPGYKIEIIVASDGSRDSTEQIVQEFAARDPRIRLVHSQGRAGKSGVQNLAVELARGEILLFTDVETGVRPDLLLQVAEHFADASVGLVAPVVHFGKFGTAVSEGQGAYWRFELLLRQLESDLGILATCSGSAFGLRRMLFRPIPPQYGDDCVLPLDVRLQGYRIVQDTNIIVYDEMPHTIEGELRARIRMTARNWSGILSRPQLLNPLRFPGTAWGLVSHKLLRWMTPFFMAAAFAANVLLVAKPEWALLLIFQSCFYAAALVGWKRLRQQPCEPIFAYAFAFCLANIGFFLGTIRSLRGQSIIAYK